MQIAFSSGCSSVGSVLVGEESRQAREGSGERLSARATERRSARNGKAHRTESGVPFALSRSSVPPLSRRNEILAARNDHELIATVFAPAALVVLLADGTFFTEAR